MLKVLVLICASSTDPSACDVHTAIDVITAARANTPQQCMFLGQAMIAPTSLAPGPKEYQKIVCARDTEVAKK